MDCPFRAVGRGCFPSVFACLTAHRTPFFGLARPGPIVSVCGTGRPVLSTSRPRFEVVINDTCLPAACSQRMARPYVWMAIHQMWPSLEA